MDTVTMGDRAAEAPLAAAPSGVKRAIVVLVGVVTIAGLLGTALTPWLLVNAPLGLIALNPATQNVVLVAPMVDSLSLVLLGTGRRLVSLLATFWVGGLFGPAMVSWVQRRYPRMGAFIRIYTRIFERFGAAFLIAVPLHSLAGIAGATGYRTLPFVLSVALGQVIQLVVMTAVAGAVAELTAQVVAFLAEHVLSATLVFVAVAITQLVVKRLRTGTWVGSLPQHPERVAFPADADDGEA